MYIKINYLKTFFRLFGLHALCMLGCILFLVMFPGMVDFRFGEIVYTLFTLIVSFDLMFSTAWTVGSRHRRDVNIHNNHLADESQRMSYSYSSGIKLAALYTAFCVLLCIITLIMASSSSPEISVAGNLIFKLWFIEFFVAFKYIIRMYKVLWVLIALTPFVPISLGFSCGIKNINFVETIVNKLVYKNK